jgi:hypothetical protein
MHRRIIKCLAGFAALSLTAGAASAADVVVPTANEAAAGASFQYGVFGNGQALSSTLQVAVAASQLSAISIGSQITSIGFRLDEAFATIAGTVDLTRFDIRIGQSALALGSLSQTFATNMGADTVLARSGALTIAGGSLIGGQAVNPFYDVAFSTPYFYKGGDLLVTINRVSTASSVPVAVDGIRQGGVLHTVAINDANATTGLVNFFRAPIMEFGFVAASAVPEPSSWAMMIGGFGLLGGAMRSTRRRKVAVSLA